MFPKARSLLALFCLVCLAGCGGNGAVANPTAASSHTPTSPPGSTPTVTPTTVPLAPSIIWTIIGSPPASIDPARAADQASVDVAGLLYEGLVRLGPGLSILPGAASSWHESNHGKTYIFHLRSGLRFSNGTLVTANDVVGSYRRAIGSLAGQTFLGSYFNEIALSGGTPDISPVGSDRVRFELKAASPQFLAKLTSPAAGIVDMATIHRYGAVWTAHADGLGPYRIARMHADGNLELKANPYYIPNTFRRRLEVRFNTQARALKSFALTSAGVITGLGDAKDLATRFAAAFHSSPSLNLDYVALNTRRAPLNNVNVRDAFALATHRLILTRSVFGSGAVSIGSPVPPLMLPGVYRQPYDAIGAIQALGRWSVTPSQKLPILHFVYPDTPLEANRARALRAMWVKTLATQITLDPVPVATYAQTVRAGSFDMAVIRWGATYPDVANYLDEQLTTTGPNNLSGWSDLSYDQLISRSRQLGIDSSARRTTLLAAAALAGKAAPWIPLDSPLQVALIGARVRGLRMTPTGVVGWEGAWAARN